MRANRSISQGHFVQIISVGTMLVVVAATSSQAAAQTRPAVHGAVPGPRRTPIAPYARPMAAAAVVSLTTGIALFSGKSQAADRFADHWHGGVLLDDAARNALRYGSAAGRRFAQGASDGAMVGTMLLATVDAMAVPLAQGDVNLSWQAGVAYSLALGMTLSIGEAFKKTIGRARPYEQNCIADPSIPGCGTTDAYGSFYSLHTSVAFTSAGFSCAMHLSRGEYGNELDAASCGVSLALATMTGVMRIAADQHYLSDTLIGGLIGFVIGYLVPVLLLPASRPIGDQANGVTATILPVVTPGLGGGTYGVSVSGRF